MLHGGQVGADARDDALLVAPDDRDDRQVLSRRVMRGARAGAVGSPAQPHFFLFASISSALGFGFSSCGETSKLSRLSTIA